MSVDATAAGMPASEGPSGTSRAGSLRGERAGQGVRRPGRRQRRVDRDPAHSIVSIIGPNGAGKTTFFNMLTGLYKPTAGRIWFGDRDITRSRPDIITSLGVARTFQNIRLFGAMTALENVMVGRHSRMRTGLFGSIFRPPARPGRGARRPQSRR